MTGPGSRFIGQEVLRREKLSPTSTTYDPFVEVVR